MSDAAAVRDVLDAAGVFDAWGVAPVEPRLADLGGSVGGTWRAEWSTSAGGRTAVVKIARAGAEASVRLAGEAHGLRVLGAAGPDAVRAPAVLARGRAGGAEVLAIEDLAAGHPPGDGPKISRPADAAAWTDFGRRLARLHAADPRALMDAADAADAADAGGPDGSPGPGRAGGHSDGGHDVDRGPRDQAQAQALPQAQAQAATAFGWPRDVWLGRTRLPAASAATWPAFLRAQRIEPLLQAAVDRGHTSAGFVRDLMPRVDRLLARLPARPRPCVTHGDLWAGNVVAMAGSPTTLAVIDPAPVVADGWSELGMMRLFGGFPAAAFDGYESVAGRPPDAVPRINAGTLLHALNHLAIFGAGYIGHVRAAVD